MHEWETYRSKEQSTTGAAVKDRDKIIRLSFSSKLPPPNYHHRRRKKKGSKDFFIVHDLPVNLRSWN
jgi:hypothetical protein